MRPDSPELTALPAALRSLLEAELAAGNRIAAIEHGFPAPPVGLVVIMENAVSTRAEHADDGLHYREWPNWRGYNGYADAREFFFVLNPPHAPPPDPVMRRDASGAAIHPSATQKAAIASPAADDGDVAGLLRRFERSMVIDYEKWHDGIGYDLDALAAMDRDQRAAAEVMLLAKGIGDWRDAQALAFLDRPSSRSALRAALEHADAPIRLAVARYAPELATPEIRAASLVSALATVRAFAGLSLALAEAAEFHPPEVMQALWRGVAEREGDVAVHFAALLTYLHGQADSIFDWAQRPLFLTFHTEDQARRAEAVEALLRRLGVSSEASLNRATDGSG